MDSTPKRRGERQPQASSKQKWQHSTAVSHSARGESKGTAAPYFHLISLAAFLILHSPRYSSTSRSRCIWAGPSNTDRVVCMKDT